MESHGSVPSVRGEHFQNVETNHVNSNSGSSVFANTGLQLLAEGRDQYVTIDARTMLVKVMEALGAQNEPTFTAIDNGDNGFKCSINVDVSSLKSLTGERISWTVVEGERGWTQAEAERNACVKALKRLTSNHHIVINDFSSRLCLRYESSNTYEIVNEAMGALEKIFGEWELAMGNCQEFALRIEEFQFIDHTHGRFSTKGQVYAILNDNLCSMLNKLDMKTTVVRSRMSEVELNRAEHGKRLAERANNEIVDKVHLNEGTLSSQDLLQYMMSDFGLESPHYNNAPTYDGLVQSEVILKFPVIKTIKISGNIKICGRGRSTVDANEEAAFQALDFIEKNMGVKIFDYNFAKRIRAFKEQKKILNLFSDILAIAETIQKLWGKMMKSVEAERVKFSFEATKLFVGQMALAQIDAYNHCKAGIEEVEKYNAECYSKFCTQYMIMQNLAWKVSVVKTELGV